MKTVIQERARQLGFDACQFTTALPPDNAAHFERWLAEGRHGGMAWLQRNAHKRVAPAQVLAGARSVITLAASYATRQPERPAAAPCDGEIARYARFSDYHDVLGARLKTLADYVNQLGGAATRSLWYVDTGPLLERDLAQRAGLGFIGKHTNLISRQLGNWFFLAEILTTLALPPDAPERNHCGSCARCLAACPTGAITAPFELDARRCISYLTIELQGPIPVELRAAMGNRIYGCDDCLAVCPWNRFAREGALMAAHRREDLSAPDLAGLLSLDEAAFRARFDGTPILRARRRGFLRNVCVALGNVGGESALAALRRAASDPEPLIAEHAVWAMGRIEAMHT
ncbi:MAG: tRNA epoxyqueuosine(34) reductase QueG [Verrucomicrobiota bacterium]